MRILIVEDDARISRPVASHLRAQHHIVEVCGDGRTGLDWALSGVYELLVLDVMLPELDGLEICRRVRTAGSMLPVMMLTARDAVADKVEALDCGADDYLVKPFALTELSARVRALGRRPADVRTAALRHGSLELDCVVMAAKYAGRMLSLTRTEFTILEALMRAPDRVFSREMILDKIAPFDARCGSDTVKAHVANLRGKIRKAGCPFNPIEVLYGYGYRLAEHR